MAEKYVTPTFQADGFHCPHCDVYSHQKWFPMFNYQREEFEGLHCSFCVRCKQYAVWVGNRMIYPSASTAPLPSEEMPEDVKEDFSEARNIVNLSPRAAAALLRLSLQKLMPHLGERGKNLNEGIANLVKRGLPEKIQKALDSVRVIGNNAVHPGQINLKDDEETAIVLFELINMIVEVTIAQSKKVNAIFGRVPEGAKKQIKKRNGTP